MSYYPDDQKAAAKELKALAKSFSVVFCVEVVGGSRTLTLTAPKNFIFGNEQLHEFVDSTNVPWHPDYKDALERLKNSPPVSCMNPVCEWCNSEEY